MLLPTELVPGVVDGSITVAFRWWKRPTVKAGGTLLTPAGQLAIDAVDVIEPADVTDDDAEAAGADSAADVLAGAVEEPGRRLHRIRFHRLGDDPRLALAATPLDADARDEVAARLARWDAAAEAPWTDATLWAIGQHPGVVSTRLAAAAGVDRDRFKRRVRKLKSLGLTESLEVGYRLSPRGESYLQGRRPT